jgi:antitoxin ParD1/3/4
MTRLTISMPDQLNAYVEGQIAQGRYGNVSEYFRDLIRRDQERRSEAMAQLRTMIEKAEASGVSERTVEEIVEEAKREAASKGLLDHGAV